MSAAETTPTAVTLLAPLIAAGMAAVHLFGRHLHFLDSVPRSRWLSFSGGVAVAYVFVHVLPEISRVSAHVGEKPLGIGFLERHVYLVALVGFLAYYGVERTAKGSRAAGDEGDAVFWTHVGSFALYNVLVGYLLLHREETGTKSLLLFGVAMGLHFLVNDWGLRHHHGDAYHRWGRWVLAGAVLCGLALGYLVAVDHAAIAALFAFLAGGVILNVIKEEVPAERESRFPSFVAGAALYTAIELLA